MPKPYHDLRAQMSPEAQAQAEAKAQVMLAAMPGGWSLWAYPVVDESPYLHRHVEIWRQDWTTPRCVNPWSLPAQMNVVDLYWRPLREEDREDVPHG